MLTSAEQLLLELTNRARLDPLQEAARYGIDLNAGLPSGTLGPEARQVLAPNAALTRAARDHSEDLINAGTFSHTGPDGSSPWQRIRDEGYFYSTAGENIAVRYTGASSINGDAAITTHHEGLFKSSGHRENILKDSFREVGVGQDVGAWNYLGGNYTASMVTEKFATRGSDIFLTGVAYSDADGDGFYDIGEGNGGIQFNVAQAGSGTTWSAGGYTVAVPGSSGEVDVTITGGGANATVKVDMANQNAKLDLIGTDEVVTSADLTVVSGVARATLLGVDSLSLTGSSGHEHLVGNRANNEISGKSGRDTLEGGAGSDELQGGGWSDVLDGGSGNDKLWGQNGRDTMEGGTGNDELYGGKGADRGEGGSGNDRLFGGNGTDKLYGEDGNDTLQGGAGADTVEGGSGSDLLYGNGGKDILKGGSGNDELRGNKGNDTLTGGDGADEFVFSSPIGLDVVTDFTVGVDTIVMNTGSDEARSFGAFIGATTQMGANAVYDFGGDGVDTITFQGVDRSSLSAGDFDFI